jgi:integrase
MPKLNHRLPCYRKHKPSGQAVVTIDGKDHYLGLHGTKTSLEEYDRLVGEWQANGRCLNQTESITVTELCAAYLRFAKVYYRKDGRITQAWHIKTTLRYVKRLYGRTLARDFGPLAFKAVRLAMISDGRFCRNYINALGGWIKRIFKWATENELVPPSVCHGLQAVSGLKKGRCEARESEPVRPVPEAFVDAVIPHVSEQVAVMIRLQQLTGMRPGEVVMMRSRDLNTGGEIWSYRPESHKTEHHGHERIIYIGPQAQAVLRPWLKADLQSYLFSAAEAEAAYKSKRRQERKTPLWPSHLKHQVGNRKRKPQRIARERYDVASYRRAISRGIGKANETIDDPDKRIPNWHPHQLRHNAATRLRREFGLEAARVVLGHRSAAVTEVYAEIDRTKAAEIMLRVG